MRTRNIIKESLLFTYNNKKAFVLAVLLFYLLDLFGEFLKELNLGQLSVGILIIQNLSFIILLGYVTSNVFRLIDKENIKLKPTPVDNAKTGFRDFLIEQYYLFIFIIINDIVFWATGVFTHLHLILNNPDLELVAIGELVNVLPTIMNINILISVLLRLLMILLALSFTYIAKIHLEHENNLKEALNPIVIHRKIIKIGHEKYLKFLGLTFITWFILLIIINFLNNILVLGAIMSAIIESLTIFTQSKSFSLLYEECWHKF